MIAIISCRPDVFVLPDEVIRWTFVVLVGGHIMIIRFRHLELVTIIQDCLLQILEKCTSYHTSEELLRSEAFIVIHIILTENPVQFRCG
jgi:hypothetical protein